MTQGIPRLRELVNASKRSDSEATTYLPLHDGADPSKLLSALKRVPLSVRVCVCDCCLCACGLSPLKMILCVCGLTVVCV